MFENIIYFQLAYSFGILLHVLDMLTTWKGLQIGLQEDNKLIKALTPSIKLNIILSGIIFIVCITFIYLVGRTIDESLTNFTIGVLNIYKLYIVLHNIILIHGVEQTIDGNNRQ